MAFCLFTVRSMYPPLDPRLLEARLSALVLAVGQLALLAQSILERHHLDWIDECLIEMDNHLLVNYNCQLCESILNSVATIFCF